MRKRKATDTTAKKKMSRGRYTPRHEASKRAREGWRRPADIVEIAGFTVFAYLYGTSTSAPAACVRGAPAG